MVAFKETMAESGQKPGAANPALLVNLQQSGICELDQLGPHGALAWSVAGGHHEIDGASIPDTYLLDNPQ